MTGKKSKEHNQNGGTLTLELWTRVTSLIKLIRILLKWKYVQYKNDANSPAMGRKRSYFTYKV